MQTSQSISPEQLREVALAVFEQGPVVVREAYSEFSSPTREFPDAEALLNDLHYEPTQGKANRYYVLYYPEAGGVVREERIRLDPKKCGGHTFRFCQEGWGLIQLLCSFSDSPRVECSVAVNSEARATGWSDTYPELDSPDRWNWEVVGRKAGRLVRLLRRLGATHSKP